MAFKMKNPSIMKMAKAAGDNRVAMKMKHESAAKMKKSPMKAEGKPSDESKDNVRQAKDLVKEMKKQRKASRKADTAANKQARKDDRAAKSDAKNLEIANKAIKKGEEKEQKILERGAKKIERRTGVTKAKRKTARNQAQTKRVVDRTKRKDDRLIMKQQDARDKAAKKIKRLEEKISPMGGTMGDSPKKMKKSAMKLDDKKDTRTAEKKTEDFNRKHSERLGTTATYNPEASKKAGKNVYTSDKTNKQMAAEHRARFERNVRKNDPNISDKEMDEAYKNRKRK
tara:strand:- start:66 stop:917 length:852 start_codon:yes stop_codon:yes gene_type:complete